MALPERVEQAIHDGLLTISRSADGNPETAYFEGACCAFVGLCELHSLKRLVLDSSDIADRCFHHVQKLTNLQSLSLQHTRVTGSALEVLRLLPNLEFLCCNPDVDVAIACQHIAVCYSLRELNLETCPLDNEHLERVMSLPKLADLNVSQIANLTDAVFDRPWTIYSPLERFRASNTSVGDRVAVAISKLETLRCIHLSSTATTDKAMECFAEMDGLRELAVCRTRVTDGGIQHLQRARSLRELEIAECDVSDDAVTWLLRMPFLQYLDAQGTRISDNGIARLKRAGIRVDV